MLVLSLDIDFFVEPVAHCVSLNTAERLPSGEFSTDNDKQVTDFLAQRCCLRTDDPVAGIAIRDHVDAWDVLKAQVRSHGPVELVHVDAHSDLGLGDRGYVYLLSDWLQKASPAEPERGLDGLNPSNWLAFAAAAEFLHRVEFVPRKYPPKDLFPCYLDPPPPAETKALVFRQITAVELHEVVSRQADLCSFLQSKSVLRRVPWCTSERSVFQMQRRPDFVILCQ